MNRQSLLPKSSTDLEKDLEEMGMLKEDLGNLDLGMINNPYTCPRSLLSWLAYTRHVDFYDESWPEQKKREVIAGAPTVHLRQGTIASVKDIVRFAGYGEIEIITSPFNYIYNGARKYNGTIKYGSRSRMEWAQFSIRMQSQITTRQAQIVKAMINATAPARCELLKIDYKSAIKYDGKHKYDGQFKYGVN